MTSTKAKSTEKFTITGDWTKWSNLLKEKHSQLTDEDLKLEAGREEEMLYRMQRRLDRNREGVIGLIKGLESPKPVKALTL